MNTFRPPSRRITSPAPSSSAWTLSSSRSTLSSLLEDEYGYYGSMGGITGDYSELSMSSQLSSSSIEVHSHSGPSISPLYASTKSSAGRAYGPTSTTAGVKGSEQTGIPSDILPRLQVLLKNQVLVFLEGVEYDDLPLGAMLHKHSYKLAARNEEILEEVRQEGCAMTSEKAHLRYFKGLYRIIRKSQFSGVGGKLWGLWKLETVIAETYRRSGIDPAIYGYPGLDSSEDDDDDMDDSEADLDSDEDGDNDLDLFGTQDETDDTDDSLDLDDTDYMDHEFGDPTILVGGIGNGPAYGPQFERVSERGLTLLLDLLREFALNRYLLATYKSILEHELVQPDEISELLTPKKLVNSAAAIRAVRVKEACIVSYMHSLTFLYKLQLLVEHERKDPEEYWDKDFEHPDYEDEPLSLLWSKGMMTMMMTHFHRAESESERYWHQQGLYHGHYQEDWSYKLMYMTSYLRFAEATVHDWFADPNAQEWEEHKQVKAENRCWFSEFGGRLMMIPSTKMYGNRAAIAGWMEGFEKEPVLDTSVSELEAKVLAGEYFKFVDMGPEWRDAATTLIKRYGGAIHVGRKNAGKSITTILRPGQEDSIRYDRGVDCSHIMDYIHRKVVQTRFSHVDKKALKNVVFSFRGILPTLTREDMKELVYTYGGFVEENLTSGIDYIVVGTRNPLDDPQAWSREMNAIEQLGICKIDEDGFAELLLKSQSWLRNGKRKAANGSAVGEVFKTTSKRRRLAIPLSLPSPDHSF